MNPNLSLSQKKRKKKKKKGGLSLQDDPTAFLVLKLNNQMM